MNLTTRVTVAALVALMMAGCGPSSKQKQLTADFTALQAKNAALQAQYDSLSQQNTALTAEIDKAKADAAALAAEKARLEASQKETVSKYDQVVQQLSSEVQAGNLQVRQYQNMLTVDVAEQLFFASGSASLKSGGKDVLKKVGAALAEFPDKVVRVVGHTDNVPLGKSAAFASNWELSAMRATNVVRYLQDNCKIAPERLIASGKGPFQPVADNGTPEGRQKNRRIEIMLLDKSVVDAVSPTADSSK